MRLAGIEFEEGDPDQMEHTVRQEKFLLPPESSENPNWWLYVPILTLQLDQVEQGWQAQLAIHHLGNLIHIISVTSNCPFNILAVAFPVGADA